MTITTLCPNCNWTVPLDHDDQKMLLKGEVVVALCASCGQVVFCEPKKIRRLYDEENGGTASIQ